MSSMNYGVTIGADYCKCGCGELVRAGRMVIQGHHARVYSQLLAYVRGQVKFGALPKSIQVIATANGIKPGNPLPDNFPKFKNRYTK